MQQKTLELIVDIMRDGGDMSSERLLEAGRRAEAKSSIAESATPFNHKSARITQDDIIREDVAMFRELDAKADRGPCLCPFL